MSAEIIRGRSQLSLRSEKRHGLEDGVNKVANGRDTDDGAGTSQSLLSKKPLNGRNRRPPKRLIEDEEGALPIQTSKRRNVAVSC